MKANEIVVLTTLFEQNLVYVNEFFFSLTNQTYKNFDLLVVNDGFCDLDTIIEKHSSLHIIELSGLGNVAKNRELLINKAIELGYVKAVFADFDDYFSFNRIFLLNKLLNDYDLIVNDLAIVSNGVVISEAYLTSAIENNKELYLEDILESNFFGMSNVAVKLSCVEKVSFDNELKAVDWFFFSKILLGGARAIYTDQCITYYRQHQSNLANIGRVTLPQLLNEIEVKKTHYSLMVKFSKIYEPLLAGVIDFCQYANNKSFVDDYYSRVEEEQRAPFWWNIFNVNDYWRIKNEIDRKN